MKIYQIYEQSGTCDDIYKNVIASYLDKDRAEKHILDLLKGLAERTSKSEKCQKCPLYNPYIEDINYDISDYCDNADIYQSDGGFSEFECNNYDIDYWIEYEDYRLEEVDVIE